MALRWQIPFTSLAGTAYTVNIYDDSYSGSPTTLTGAPNTFETYEEDSEDIFTPLRGQSGYLRVIDTDGTLIDQIVPANNTSCLVYLMQGPTSILWRGYLQARVYTQPWDAGAHILELPVRSLLSSLSDVYPAEADAGKISRLGAVIYDALSSVTSGAGQMGGFTSLVAISDGVLSISSQMLYQKIRRSQFYEYDEEISGDIAVRKYIGKSWSEVLSSILATFGLMARESGTVVYLAQYDHPGSTCYKTTFSASDMANMESNPPSVPTGVRLSDSNFFSSVTWAGSGHEVSLFPGGREAVVSVEVANPRKELSAPDGLEQSDDQTTDISVNDGEQVAFQTPAVSNSRESFYYFLLSYSIAGSGARINYSSVRAASYAECLADCIINRPGPMYSSSRQIVTGAIPVRFSLGTATNPGTLADGLLINRQWGASLVDTIVWPQVIYILSSGVSHQFVEGALNIKFSVLPFYHVPPFGTSPGILYFDKLPPSVKEFETQAYVGIRIGSYYYHGHDQTWSTEAYWNPIRIKDGEIISNKDYMGYSCSPETGGYFVPVDPSLSGPVIIELQSFADSSDADVHNMDFHACIMTDLNVSFLPKEGIIASDRNEVTYRKSVISGFSDKRSLDLTIGTVNNNRPCAGMLIDPYGKYLRTMTYFVSGAGGIQRPEVHLLNRFSTWLSKMRRAYYAEVSSGLSLCDRRYTIDSKPYVAIDSRHDWINDRQRLRLIELAGDNE